MASRRAPNRQRVNSNLAQQAPSRPRSVMAAHPELSSSIPSSKNPKTVSQDDGETNIQVVLRCRRRSEREIQDNSPIIVSCAGPKNHEVTIETSIPQSALGIVTLPPTRTYPFDLVFGPEADQAIIYHEVVAPMLAEVMQGYNCTLFAYGQTGTGKTYTMQGDLTPTPMGNPSAQAGVIPRVLFRLFHELEKSGLDYSVKISFIELYNEELRDLLANELPAPAGTTQPMGQGSGTPKDPISQGGLKIFDDANKKGVFIQGLEETCVKDSADALRLLNKGSQRRQIAATKFNDHSSRSHSVFSITVHIKETSSMGDDLLKVGKLNLVDLAGSENIGRSGAENKRAREAGMINQSLLTLGRVINALVDRSQHVPYRESKLTRLLQDSLGGRTKTCIIATISPARSNIEETLSTLDYAIRAKSIRNKPEVNQRLTRNALLKEYVAEIERLKADLLAAREKNGIFFSEETWTQLTAEQELRQTEFEEAKKQVEIVESQMRAVREEFDQSIALLMKREGQLKATKDQLKATEGALVEKEDELKATQRALEEEVVVRQAHQDTEVALDGVAVGLKRVASESIADVGALFEKLNRKSRVFNSNSQVVSSHGKAISSEYKVLASELDVFIRAASQHTQKLRSGAREFQNAQLESLHSHCRQIDQQIQRIQDATKLIQAQDKISQDAITIINDTVKATGENIGSAVQSWSENLQNSFEKLFGDLETSGAAGYAAMEKALQALVSLLHSTIRDTREHVDTEEKLAMETKSHVSTAVNAEIAHLREQNVFLARLVDSERTKGANARDELIERVSGLLTEFTATRDRELKEGFESFRNANVRCEKRLGELEVGHGIRMDTFVMKAKDVSKVTERRSTEGKRAKDTALKAMNSAQTATGAHFSNARSSVSNSLTKYSDELRSYVRNMNATSTTAFDGHGRAKRARTETTSALTKDIQSDYRHLQREIVSTATSIENFARGVASGSSSLTTVTDSYHGATSSHLASASQATQLLIDQGAKEDIPTGKTPRKRAWRYVDNWGLTKSREDILKSLRQREISKVDGDENVAALPLPEERKKDEGTSGEAESSASEKSDEARTSSSATSPFATSISSSSSSIPQPPDPDKHGQLGINIQEPGTMERGRGATGSGHSVPENWKSGMGTKVGTLTDRPINITNRPPRRVR